MDAQGDRYSVTAVPIPEPTGPWTLRLAARFDNATLEASTQERSLTIGGRDVKLSEVRRIFLGAPSRVVLRSGLTLTGALIGRESVPVRLSGPTMAVDLTSAREVAITPVGEVEQVACTLVVRQGESEVYRLSLSANDSGLLKNSGFDLGLEGWEPAVISARPQITFDTSVVRQGRQSLRVEANELSDTAFGQEVQLSAGQWYRFTGWVRTRGLNPHGSHVYGTLQVHTAVGNTIATGTNRPERRYRVEQRLRSSFRAFPWGSDPLLCAFQAGFGKGTGTAWFDDL